MGKSGDEREQLFYRGDAEGAYLISPHYGDDFAIAELTPEEQATLEKKTHQHPVRDLSIGTGSALANVGVAVAANTAGMPLWAFITGEATTLSACIGVQGRSIVSDKWTIRQQRKIAASISADSGRYMKFGKEFTQFSLPRSVLDEAVEFESEFGTTQRTVGELATSAKNDFFGIKVEIPEDKDQPIEGSVSPGNLLSNALVHFSRNDRPSFIDASYQSIERMHESARQLPRYNMSMEGLPEGIRQLNEQHKIGLFIGALGVYGVVRAQVGLAVSESISDLYAVHGSEDLRDDPLLKDAKLFSAPTENNLTWRQIDQTRSYIKYTQPLDD